MSSGTQQAEFPLLDEQVGRARQDTRWPAGPVARVVDCFLVSALRHRTSSGKMIAALSKNISATERRAARKPETVVRYFAGSANGCDWYE
ncbi:hypothetical protein RX327_31790 [Bradyrhizobium sp. BEA-2-5]|uniref:hypothetical protein n=1 Tax=Bradyrhizobium sp. BEA-2-5 TaxID=3080015 RepID=UPI00293E267F|nr:hypothetical protein [Bradyrhizobium sp. BEA-2-5]WOH80354.1 hypothetical protein RX327_31790 [Bradyrhizobium sp. BEA-2-5]